jgi:hypothetical protein
MCSIDKITTNVTIITDNNLTGLMVLSERAGHIEEMAISEVEEILEVEAISITTGDRYNASFARILDT